MGCLQSNPADIAASKANATIEKDTEKYKQVETIKYKLLLLGAGESGKSTLLKQMRMLHGKQFDQSELMAAKPHLTQVLNQMHIIHYHSIISGTKLRKCVKYTECHRGHANIGHIL